MASKYVEDLLVAIDALDVNRVSDALSAARLISKANPGVLSTEVDLAEQAGRKAIHELLEAQGHLKRAIGNLVVAEHRRG